MKLKERKMMWKKGDKAYCIHKGLWTNTVTKELMVGPSYGEICLVECVETPPYGKLGLKISGYQVFTSEGEETTYLASRFRKIIPKSERSELTHDRLFSR